MDMVGVSSSSSGGGGGSVASVCLARCGSPSTVGLIEVVFLSGPANDDEGPGESGLSPQAEG